MKYKLYTGIKNVIEANGKEVLNSVLLSNILADYGVFEEYPTTKIVLKDLLSNGYGKKILNGIAGNKNSTKKVIVNIKKEFEKNYRYKKDIVNYVFESIAFGLGIVADVEEPFSTGFDPYASKADGILDNLPDMLAELKREYTDSLETLLVKPKDVIWDAPAYYTAKSENQLFLLEGKIFVISRQLGLQDTGWCDKQKALKLHSHLTKKHQVAQEFLDSQKSEYLLLIKKSFKEPNINGKSICFDDTQISAIEKYEHTIISLYREVGKTYDGWCESQKGLLINTALNKLKTEYQGLIKKAIVIPTSKIISRSAYFDSSYTSNIEEQEFLIKSLYKESGNTYDNWCEIQKDKILSPHIVPKTKQIRQAFLKVFLPIIIAVTGGTRYLAYNSADKDIANYERIISIGDDNFAKGNYGEAIANYLNAGETYNASYNKSSYKDDAMDKANECFDDLRLHISNQLQNKKYKLIHEELASIPQNYLNQNPEDKEWIKETHEQVLSAANSEVDNLISIVAKNNGQLDEQGKELLNEVLLVSPDNYWFKFLKNKEQ